MTGLIQLQERYLETQDESCLADLYTEIIKLGKIILYRNNLPLDEDEVYDLASQLTVRLMQEKKPLFKCASAYIKTALYFRSGKKAKLLSNQTVEIPEDYCTEDEYLSDEMFEIYADQVIELSDIDDDLVPYVRKCLLEKSRIESVRKEITDNSRKKRFTEQMEEVRNVIKEDMQGYRMQCTCSDESGLLSETCLSHERGQREEMDAEHRSSVPETVCLSTVETAAFCDSRGQYYLPGMSPLDGYGSAPRRATQRLTGLVLR